MNGVPQWAEDRAKSIVMPEETILGIYTISDKNRRNAVRSPLAMMLWCPLFWPLLIFASPCMLTSMSVQSAILKSTVYVITDKRLYKSIDPAEVGNACFMPGRDSGDVLLQDITGVYLDMPSRVMGKKVLPVQQVIVNLPIGHPLADPIPTDSEYGMEIRTCMHMLVDDPQEVINVLRKAKDTEQSQPQPVVISNTVPGTAVPENRTNQNIQDSYDVLLKLKELLDAGAITQEEYDEKKKIQLRRM